MQALGLLFDPSVSAVQLVDIGHAVELAVWQRFYCHPSTSVQALGLLFDPAVSAVQLVDIEVTSPRTIEAQWRMGGYLRFPCELCRIRTC